MTTDTGAPPLLRITIDLTDEPELHAVVHSGWPDEPPISVLDGIVSELRNRLAEVMPDSVGEWAVTTTRVPAEPARTLPSVIVFAPLDTEPPF